MADKPRSAPEIRMRNVIMTFDGYVMAKSDDQAVEAFREMIQRGQLTPTHAKALEIRVSPIQPRCRDEAPIVAADVSDEELMQFKGMTTQQAYELLTQRSGGR